MLLKVSHVYKSFPVLQGIFKKGKQEVLHDVSFEMKAGECLGIVGESGSGKSTLGRIILDIEPVDSGQVMFNDSALDSEHKSIRSVVFQDYVSSVNPKMKVRDIIAEPLITIDYDKSNMDVKINELLVNVGLSEAFVTRYPHELSGGQLQRVCIARAIATNPQFILLDEAVSSLDVAIQMQVMDLLIELKEKMNLSYLFISHDLLAVTYMCDRILFFKEGRIIEEVENIEDLSKVQHEYSKLLLSNI